MADHQLNHLRMRGNFYDVAAPLSYKFGRNIVSLIIDRFLHRETTEGVPLPTVVLAAIWAKRVATLPALDAETRI